VMKRCRNYVMRRCRSGSEGERDLKVSTMKLRNVPDTLLTHCTHPAGVDAGRGLMTTPTGCQQKMTSRRVAFACPFRAMSS
jgi:hypothetical protein